MTTENFIITYFGVATMTFDLFVEYIEELILRYKQTTRSENTPAFPTRFNRREPIYYNKFGKKAVGRFVKFFASAHQAGHGNGAGPDTCASSIMLYLFSVPES